MIYLEGILRGKVAPSQTTVEVPRTFRPIGALITAVPNGLPGDLSVYATLLPPATGSYAAGNRPRLHIALTGLGAVVGDGDLLVIEC
jgi:hypothetical protein